MKKSLALIFCAMLGMVKAAHARQEDTTATIRYTNCNTGALDHIDFDNNTPFVNLDNLQSSCDIVIYVTAPTDVNIPPIHIRSGPGAGHRINVAIGSSFRTDTLAPAKTALNWKGLDAISGLAPVYLYGGITGDLIGPVTVDEVYRLDVGGAIASTFTMHAQAGGTGVATIYATSISATGQIQNITTDTDHPADGRLKEITISGDVLGAKHGVTRSSISGGIFNEYGPIGDVTIGGKLESFIQARRSTIHSIVVTNDIDIQNGPLSAPNNDQLEPISARSIEFVTAQSIYAEINAADTFNGGTPTGHVTLVKTTGAPSAGFGYVKGNIRFRSLSNASGAPESGIKIAGDAIWDGRSFAGTHVGVVTIDSGGTVNVPVIIAGSLQGDILCYGSTGTLPNQIVINAANVGAAWTTSGTLATSMLTIGTDPSVFDQPYLGPYYDATDAQLGGGAVGVVPFVLHDQDCLPTNGGSGAPLVTGSSVRLRFYGPVECPTCTSTLAPVRVEYYQTDYSPFSWVDVTSHYNFTYDNNNRDLIVTAKDNLFGGDDVAVNMRVTPYSRLTSARNPS